MASPFHSLYSHDFVRIAACVPRIQVAGVAANLEETIRVAREGHALSTALIVFPELGLSAYAIDDLLLQDALLDAVEHAIDQLVEANVPFLVQHGLGDAMRAPWSIGKRAGKGERLGLEVGGRM